MRVNIDIAAFMQLVEQHYLTVQRHPSAPLLIFNYSAKAQYDRFWTPETLTARGLIVTPEGEIVARPFPKFFNLGEHASDLPLEPFEVYEKLDGSLGILYHVDDVPYLATRGSFISDQAQRGTRILHERYGGFPFDPRYTYLFEIIYPENRIVVDYAGREELVLLAVVETATGAELDIHASDWPFPIVERFAGIDDLAELRAHQADNREGFVIRFQSGLRLKVKFDEYVRLHRLVTGVNERVIWELLREDQPFEQVLERVPDEFYAYVTATRDGLLARFAEIEQACRAVAREVEHLPTRKEQAAVITRTPYPSIVFAMLDGKDYRDGIWRLLRPAHTPPFRRDE
jgi:RNA ligase